MVKKTLKNQDLSNSPETYRMSPSRQDQAHGLGFDVRVIEKAGQESSHSNFNSPKVLNESSNAITGIND